MRKLTELIKIAKDKKGPSLPSLTSPATLGMLGAAGAVVGASGVGGFKLGKALRKMLRGGTTITSGMMRQLRIAKKAAENKAKGVRGKAAVIDTSKI